MWEDEGSPSDGSPSLVLRGKEEGPRCASA